MVAESIIAETETSRKIEENKLGAVHVPQKLLEEEKSNAIFFYFPKVQNKTGMLLKKPWCVPEKKFACSQPLNLEEHHHFLSLEIQELQIAPDLGLIITPPMPPARHLNVNIMLK